MTRKLTLITPILLAGTMLCGCEVAGPLLIGEATKGSDDDLGSSSALLTVDIESASGMVAGRPVTPEMFVVADGERVGSQLSFTIATPSDDLEVMIMTNQTESSNDNPYTGEGGDGFEGFEGSGSPPRPIGAGEEPDSSGGTLPDTGAFATVLVCEAGVCRDATDFGIEVVQTENGRRAFVDGLWEGDENLQLAFHYTENR